MKRCVVTGLGAVTPIGIGKEDFWKSLTEGRPNYSEINRFQLQDFDKTRIAAQIKDFDPALYVDKKIVESIESLQATHGGLSIYYGVAGAKLALDDAQITSSNSDLERVGVIMGSGSGDVALLQRANTDLTHGTYSLANALPGIVAKQFRLHGLATAVSGACATGNLTLRAGYKEIRQGDHDVMVVGSSEAPIDIPHYMGSEKHRRDGVKGLSQKNDVSRGMIPFDECRDGIVLSEGAGVLVLEELEHVKRRGAHIYAEILGYGDYTDFDSNLIRITEKGYLYAMRNALRNSNIGSKDLLRGYVNAHGTGTLLNDPNESRAIFSLFGNKVPVSSFKGTTGHLQAAAPGIELVGSALVLDRQCIPSTNLREVAHDCAPLDYVIERRNEKIDFVIKNAAGFNGVYSSIVLSKYKD